MGSLAAEPDNSVAAQRDAIFNDINAHLTKVVDLKIHLNSLTHIGQLPNEVLAEIFVAYARDCYRLAARDRSWLASSPTWVKLAHVCRHWREVALETPRFWSYVDVKKPKAFFALLPRSKSSPLYIDLALDQHTWSNAGMCIEATKLIGQQSQRLRELRFVAKLKEIRALLGNLSCSLPLLQTLVLSDRRGAASGDASDDSRAILSTDGQAPRLRHLELHRLAFTWTDPVFCQTLTTLVVVGKAYRGGDSHTGTFEQFIDAFKAMAPSLVDLTLEQSVPRLPSHTTQPPPARGPFVALPSLQTLRILCDTNDCVRFMDHLSINPAATMEITGNLGTDSGIKRLLEIVSAHASRSTPLLASRISLPHPHTRSAISIRGYRDVDVRRLDLDELGDIDVTFDNLQPGDRPFAAALRGAGAIFSGVQYLSLVSENGSNVSWPSLFECVPSVETLEILGHPGPGFAEALFHLRDVQNGESSATSGPLLRLRELKLDDVYFRRWDGASWSHGGEFFDKLLDWTILRCNYGIPLERLQVWQCRYATVKDIHRLREIVVEVDWDMWEQESDEDEDEDEGDDDDFYAHHHPIYGWY